MQRGPVVILLGLDIGALGEERLHHVAVAFLRRGHQRGHRKLLLTSASGGRRRHHPEQGPSQTVRSNFRLCSRSSCSASRWPQLAALAGYLAPLRHPVDGRCGRPEPTSPCSAAARALAGPPRRGRPPGQRDQDPPPTSASVPLHTLLSPTPAGCVVRRSPPRFRAGADPQATHWEPQACHLLGRRRARMVAAPRAIGKARGRSRRSDGREVLKSHIRRRNCSGAPDDHRRPRPPLRRFARCLKTECGDRAPDPAGQRSPSGTGRMRGTDGYSVPRRVPDGRPGDARGYR